MNVAIIPARSGSKGIPGKNLLSFRGRSLIALAADCAYRTGAFDSVFLSTDDPEYAQEGAKSGCTVPYLRPPQLARDDSSVADVISELLDRLDQGGHWTSFAILEPTCPLRTPEMVVSCMRLCLESPDVDSSLTVSAIPLKYHYLKQFNLGSEGCVSFAHENGSGVTNRQALRPTYIRNGAVYVARCRPFLSERRVPCGRIKALVIDEPLVNLDTPDDLAQLRRME
jgi:CMP-N,N'-diacetyllegionaminic acid synthase